MFDLEVLYTIDWKVTEVEIFADLCKKYMKNLVEK